MAKNKDETVKIKRPKKSSYHTDSKSHYNKNTRGSSIDEKTSSRQTLSKDQTTRDAMREIKKKKKADRKKARRKSILVVFLIVLIIFLLISIVRGL